jgi:ABC-type sugar transport systems, permease components
MQTLRRLAHRPAPVALLFFTLVLLFFFGSIFWTGYMSLTGSTLLPSDKFVGLAQYERLWSNKRWLVSVGNLVIYGALYLVFAVSLGTFLAILLDRAKFAVSLFRTIYLYPLAVSLIVTGLSWRWILDPASGLQQMVRNLGFESFSFDWLADPDRSIYTLVIASVWQSTGLVMVIMLAGLRGVDTDLWKAIRLEGIKPWRAYLQVIIPTMRPMLNTCIVLITSQVIKGYDLVISLTQGGPGFSSELPAKFAVDFFFARINIGLASAASIMMLLVVLLLLGPYFYSEFRRRL